MGQIYCHTAPNGSTYVGQTFYTWQHRAKPNPHKAYRKSPKLYAAILQFGWDNFTHEVLADGVDDEEELNRLEAFWIEKLDSVNTGLNSYRGGGSRRTQIENSKAKLPRRCANPNCDADFINRRLRTLTCSKRCASAYARSIKRPSYGGGAPLGNSNAKGNRGGLITAHKRHHTNKGIFNSACAICVEA